MNQIDVVGLIEIAPHTILVLPLKLPSPFLAFRYALYNIQLSLVIVGPYFSYPVYEKEPGLTSRILYFDKFLFIEWYVLSLQDVLVFVQLAIHLIANEVDGD